MRYPIIYYQRKSVEALLPLTASLGMEMRKVYSLMADVVLVIHFLFIAFVLVGQACIVMGYFRSWNWVRRRMFRVCHILAVAVVVAQAWANHLCPLTLWEKALREMAGEQTYAETFIQHWVGKLTFAMQKLTCGGLLKEPRKGLERQAISL